ncbi:hypothetical protein GQ457_07G032010 [Hibiscus cannabinus]
MMLQIQQLIRGAKNAVSLAQYTGNHPNRHWIRSKNLWKSLDHCVSRQENNLNKSSVMVTAGANQDCLKLPFVCLCNRHLLIWFLHGAMRGIQFVMFAPYYFNAYMSFPMTGVTKILLGPSNPETLYPDADWLEKTLLETNPVPKLVSVVNLGNPSGTYIPEPLLKIAYPTEVEGLATQLFKVQDNIPICASLISQRQTG